MAALTALVYLVMTAQRNPNVVLVFPNAHLMQRDRSSFVNSFRCANLLDKVQYCAGLEALPAFTAQSQTLLLFDEADAFIFGDPAQFDRIVDKTPCICLTATPSADAGESVIESTLLAHLNFQVIHCGVSAAADLEVHGKLAQDEMVRALHNPSETTLVHTTDA